MAEFPHKPWAHPDHKATYDEAVARMKEIDPDAVVPSHLDPRGLPHVLAMLEKMESDAA